MMIIVTKPGIIIDVVGSYFYEKIVTENGPFVLGGPETQLHDILWAVHDGKNHTRLRWAVRVRAMRVSLIQLRACVRCVGSN